MRLHYLYFVLADKSFQFFVRSKVQNCNQFINCYTNAKNKHRHTYTQKKEFQNGLDYLQEKVRTYIYHFVNCKIIGRRHIIEINQLLKYRIICWKNSIFSQSLLVVFDMLLTGLAHIIFFTSFNMLNSRF